MERAAEIVGIVRDVFLIGGFSLAILALFLIYRKVSGALDSLGRVIRRGEEVADAVSSRFVGPAVAGSGLAFGAGKFASFVLGLRNKKKERKGEDSDG